MGRHRDPWTHHVPLPEPARSTRIDAGDGPNGRSRVVHPDRPTPGRARAQRLGRAHRTRAARPLRRGRPAAQPRPRWVDAEGHATSRHEPAATPSSSSSSRRWPVPRPIERLPPGLRDVLVDRLAALPDPTRRVLRAASAAGRRVDEELLASVLELSVSAVGDALRPALSHGMLVDAEASEAGSAGTPSAMRCWPRSPTASCSTASAIGSTPASASSWSDAARSAACR